MGYQDRDYYRERESESGVQSMVIKLIIINAVLFLADAFFGGQGEHSITKALMLQGDAIAHPWKWYQFLTAGFVHDWDNLWHVGGNMFGLYIFGQPMEQRLGRREFLRFYLASIVAGSVIWSLRNYFLVGPTVEIGAGGAEILHWGACLGASGGVTATMILFCCFYPRATLLLFFAIPTPAWVAAVLLIAMDMLGTHFVELGQRVAHDVHLTGAAFALSYWYFGWNLGRFPGSAQLRRWMKGPQRWLEGKPKLRTFDPEPSYDDLDSEADQLLEKIAREGEASLTPRERRILEAYSRRLRQKLR